MESLPTRIPRLLSAHVEQHNAFEGGFNPTAYCSNVSKYLSVGFRRLYGANRGQHNKVRLGVPEKRCSCHARAR